VQINRGGQIDGMLSKKRQPPKRPAGSRATLSLQLLLSKTLYSSNLCYRLHLNSPPIVKIQSGQQLPILLQHEFRPQAPFTFLGLAAHPATHRLASVTF
jgi:hypothetical protein